MLKRKKKFSLPGLLVLGLALLAGGACGGEKTFHEIELSRDGLRGVGELSGARPKPNSIIKSPPVSVRLKKSNTFATMCLI